MPCTDAVHQFLPLAAKLLAALPDTLLFFNHAGVHGDVGAAAGGIGAIGLSARRRAYADVGARFGISLPRSAN